MLSTLPHSQLGLTPLASGFHLGEAPRWFEGLLWFSDSLGEAVHTFDLLHQSMTTLPVPGHTPGGLGFRPDGSLLIASADDRLVLSYDGEMLTRIADLTDTAPASLGDMVVDDVGRAYVGCRARDGGIIVRIDPDDTVTVVADDLDLPNGMVISADRSTLIVAESISRRLTAFTVDAADGSLSGRRVFADGLIGAPDGIAMDDDGGVWTSLTLTCQFQRIVAGGAVTACIDVGDRTAIACTLGGPGRRMLFLLSSSGVDAHRLSGLKLSRLDAVTVDIPGAGLP